MAKVRAALIQAYANLPKQEAIEKHEGLIRQAAAQGAQITCLQEVFFGPYFCAEQDPKWYATAERDDGPTVRRMQELARPHPPVLVVPLFRGGPTRGSFNTTVVLQKNRPGRGEERQTPTPPPGPCVLV